MKGGWKEKKEESILFSHRVQSLGSGCRASRVGSVESEPTSVVVGEVTVVVMGLYKILVPYSPRRGLSDVTLDRNVL